MLMHIDSFNLPWVLTDSYFVFVVDGRSDFGPGRSRVGGIYGSGP